jgi:hypothetical protein
MAGRVIRDGLASCRVFSEHRNWTPFTATALTAGLAEIFRCRRPTKWDRLKAWPPVWGESKLYDDMECRDITSDGCSRPNPSMA